MQYFNEATAEMISGAEPRHGVIPIKKTISIRDECQDEFVSSDNLTIMTSELDVDQVVKLNYIGEKDYLERNDYPVNDKVIADPCLHIVRRNGLKVLSCEDIPDAEMIEVFEIGLGISIERKEAYFAYATTFVLHKAGNYVLMDSSFTDKVHIEGTMLKLGVGNLVSLETDRRHLITIYKVHGVWVDYHYQSKSTIFTIVMLGDTIVGVGVNTNVTDTDYKVSTYKHGLSTYSAVGYNFHPSEDMPDVLTHNFPRMSNPWWANNDATYAEVYAKMGPVLNKVCDIIKELKGGCK